MNINAELTQIRLAKKILVIIILLFFVVNIPACFGSSAHNSLESFIYVGCTQLKYNPGTPFESNLNSVLASLVNSAAISNFNNFKISLPGSAQGDAVSGLFQCRGDLRNSDCRECVSDAVSRLGTYCVGTSGGALQLEGCFVKYDNASFLGAQDKAVVSSKCGTGYGGGESLTRRDAVLAYLTSGQYFRVGGSGDVEGMAQCVEDLSMSECQDCLSEAIQRLKSDHGCGGVWGDMFLGKCYARYSSTRSTAAPASGPSWLVFYFCLFFYISLLVSDRI